MSYLYDGNYAELCGVPDLRTGGEVGMTNETVIAILSELKKCYLGGIVDALDFAIEAVKAQNPCVMTLEEALGSEEGWLERKDGSVTVADIALNGQDSGGYDVDSNELNTMRSYIFHSGYYGKYWRCWTSRPTEAEREATPWE